MKPAALTLTVLTLLAPLQVPFRLSKYAPTANGGHLSPADVQQWRTKAADFVGRCKLTFELLPLASLTAGEDDKNGDALQVFRQTVSATLARCSETPDIFSSLKKQPYSLVYNEEIARVIRDIDDAFTVLGDVTNEGSYSVKGVSPELQLALQHLSVEGALYQRDQDVRCMHLEMWYERYSPEPKW